MRCAARFEQLMAERKATVASENLNDQEILTELFQKYNGFKANSALKRWQISADQQSAISGVILGMCEEARALVRAHLDFNKYEESGRLPLVLVFMPSRLQRVLAPVQAPPAE